MNDLSWHRDRRFSACATGFPHYWPAKEIIETFCELQSFERGFILWTHSNRDRVCHLVGPGVPMRSKELTVRVGDGILGWCPGIGTLGLETRLELELEQYAM